MHNTSGDKTVEGKDRRCLNVETFTVRHQTPHMSITAGGRVREIAMPIQIVNVTYDATAGINVTVEAPLNPTPIITPNGVALPVTAAGAGMWTAAKAGPLPAGTYTVEASIPGTGAYQSATFIIEPPVSEVGTG